MIVGTPTVLNIVPSGVMPVVYINQTDAGYTKEFRIYNGAQPYNVPANVSASIRGTKGDGYGVAETATVMRDSNLVTVDITEQMTAVAGKNIYELIFIDTNGLRVGTINFILWVEQSALDSGTVISDSDIAYAEQVLNQIGSVSAFKNQLDNTGEDLEQLDKQVGISDYGKFEFSLTILQRYAESIVNYGPQAFVHLSNGSWIVSLSCPNNVTRFLFLSSVGAITDTFSGTFYHSNSLAVDEANDLLYSADSVDNTVTPLATMNSISIFKLSTKTYLRRITVSAVSSITGLALVDGNLYILTNDYQFGTVDTSTGAFTLVASLEQIPQKNGTSQSIEYDGNFIYWVHSNPNSVYVYRKDGTFVRNIAVGETAQGVYPIWELEDIIVDGMDIYCLSLGPTRTQSGMPLYGRPSIMIGYCDSRASIAADLAKSRYYGTDSIFVDPQTTQYQPTGTSSAPFKYLEDAILCAQTHDSQRININIMNDVDEYVIIEGAQKSIRFIGNGHEIPNFYFYDGADVAITNANISGKYAGAYKPHGTKCAIDFDNYKNVFLSLSACTCVLAESDIVFMRLAAGAYVVMDSSNSITGGDTAKRFEYYSNSRGIINVTNLGMTELDNAVYPDLTFYPAPQMLPYNYSSYDVISVVGTLKNGQSADAPYLAYLDAQGYMGNIKIRLQTTWGRIFTETALSYLKSGFKFYVPFVTSVFYCVYFTLKYDATTQKLSCTVKRCYNNTVSDDNESGTNLAVLLR